MNMSFKYSWRFGGTYLMALVARNIGHLTINYGIMRTFKPELNFVELSARDVNLTLLRGVLSTLGSTFTTLGVFYLDITEAFVISQTKPFVTLALNRIAYKEPLNKYQAIACVVCFSGVVLMLQPAFLFGASYEWTRDRLTGIIIRLISVFAASFSDLTLKQIGTKLQTYYVIHFMGITNSLSFGLAYGIFDTPKIESAPCYLALLGVGLFSWFTHYFYSRAYQVGPINLVSIFESTGVLLGFAADYFLSSKVYNFYSYLGVFLIIASLYICTLK